MDKNQIIEHNQNVIRNVLTALVESGMVDALRLFTDKEYCSECFFTYMEAANIARKMMNMEPLVLYTISEDEED
jgi:hypothetical protein